MSLADRLDTIAAFFHVGMIPSGSEDPFALRRHATAIVRIILEKDLRVNVGEFVDHAINLLVDSGIKGTADSPQQGRQRIVDFLFERVRHYGRTVHAFRDDVMDAVLRAASAGAIDLVDLLLKMKAMQAVTAKPDFDPLIVGFKRASRIVEKEQWERGPSIQTGFRILLKATCTAGSASAGRMSTGKWLKDGTTRRWRRWLGSSRPLTPFLPTSW